VKGGERGRLSGALTWMEADTESGLGTLILSGGDDLDGERIHNNN
jgi:hypothetical protein